MLMPMLSEADPRISTEGTIDPLGTYAISDALAVRLIPGVRERQQHTRFLTSMAVSLSICGEFDQELIAADEISEPWQVFEWHVVEGLVRTAADPKSLRGLPGQDKAAKAIKDGVPLSAKRYLKTATVFGFHGVYRALSRDVEIECADRLGDVGYELITTWEKEQGLQGFCGTGQGPGKAIRMRLVDAIRDGLAQGAVARASGWGGWTFFRDHLGIYSAGKSEAKVIRDALMEPKSKLRREVLGCLTSPVGAALWKAESEKKYPSERRFHEALMQVATPELTELIVAIDQYELFSRYIQDAFDDCLLHLSQHQQRISPTELAGLSSVRKASAEVPRMFAEVSDRLSPFGEVVRFVEQFNSLAENVSNLDWLERLLEHHTRIQRSKPPTGKAPWLDRFDDGTCMIRTGYIRDFGGRHDDSYVHAYRTGSLWSFSLDLGLVK